MLPTYRPSGRIGALMLPVALACIVVLVAIAWVYQLLVSWIPFIYLNVLATVGFAIIAAIAVSLMVRGGRCRSIPAALLLAVVVTVPAIAATHFFQYQRLRAKVASTLQDPEREAFLAAFDFTEYVRVRVDKGWSISRRGQSSSVNGAAVYAIWAIEALVVLGAAIAAAMSSARTPFCESCQQWTSDPERFMVRADQSDESLRQLERAATVVDLVDSPAVEPPGSSLVTYEMRACPACEESNYLTLKKVVLKKNRKGKVEEKSTAILNHVHATAADLQHIKESVQRQAQALEREMSAADDPAKAS